MNAKIIAAAAAVCLASAAGAEPLTSERAVAIALERNPELAGLAAEARAARARLADAELPLRANPEISAAAGPRSRGDRRTTDVEVAVSQRVELFGQRGARIDVTSAERDVSEARLAARRVGLASEVRASFARVLAAERLIALAREDLTVARDAVHAVERRFELGATTQLEVNAARVEGARAARAVAVASRRQASALSELRTLLGSEPGTPLELAGALPRAIRAAPLDTEGLVNRALSARTDLVAARRELAAAESEVRLARRESLPAPAIGGRYSREEGADIVLGTLTFELPVFNRNQGGRGVASARVARAEAEVAAAERRVREEVRLAVSRLETAAEAAQAFEGEALAGAAANVTLATKAYDAGKIGVAELLLIRRGAVEARREHVEALAELAEAEAELARAMGSEAPFGGAG
ncbi:TolC family protein [Anaeromyxobacter sp. SG66]|uniref:TolC family protein n=1 Tax=Anaeromyxobacter sp. SG66 TaxID=2925410 RepID=UPI001F57D0E9|nr:TolC family protein [Anaeromyxobacter sp. SG66]